MPRRQKQRKGRQQQKQPDPQPQVATGPTPPQPGPSGLARPAETNEAVETHVELRVPEPDAHYQARRKRLLSADVNIILEEEEQQCIDKRPGDPAEQGQAAPKRPKVQEVPQQATEPEENSRPIPLEVSGATCKEFLIGGGRRLVVRVSWTNASAATTLTVNTNIKDAAVQTTDGLQNIQMDDSDVVEKEAENDPEDDTPEDPKTDATIERVAPQAESAFSRTDGNSSNQMGAAVAVNDTPSLSVTGSSIVVKTEPETDSFNDAVEDSKPLLGLQTECHLCLTHGYLRSHLEATDDIKPSLYDDDNMVGVKTEPETDSLNDAVEDSKPLLGLQTECPLCPTHGYLISHLEATDDIKPSLYDDDNMSQNESNLQPTSQHTYGDRSVQGN